MSQMGCWWRRPAAPAPGPGRPSPLPHQRYLDEAEREKQQYMKELRAYQQSEAYKMCTEKIQEKKIKKGGKGTQPPGSWVRAQRQVAPGGPSRPPPWDSPNQTEC